MFDLGNGTLETHWGRVEGSHQVTNYDIYKWDSILRSKLKKGYKDVTHLHANNGNGNGDESTTLDIADHQTRNIVELLQSYANRSVKANYTVSSKNVTQAQVEEAQEIIDRMVGSAKIGVSTTVLNSFLIELFHVIPRKIKKVQWEVFDFHRIDTQSDLDTVNKKIENEQATLDVMRGQVQLHQDQQDAKEEKKDILGEMGLEIKPVKDQNEIDLIKRHLGPNSRQFKRAFEVVCRKTQRSFDSNLQRCRIKSTKLFWHGSRNENWWSILQSGLVLRPANAITTGKMFGYGLYFADKAQKSIGYTSLRGSYWTSGSSSNGFMALFNVHVGRWLHARRHESWMYSLTDSKLRSRGDYDSLFAEGGIDLRNNEYIVYNENQCTVKYLVELND